MIISIVIFYIFVGACAVVAENITTDDLPYWKLLVTGLIWPLPVTLMALIRLFDEKS